MTPAGIAIVIAAVTSLITAIGGVLLAVRQADVKAQVIRTYITVNQQRTDMLRLIETYQQLLQRAGVTIPVDVSLARPTPEESKGAPSAGAA